MSDGEKVVILGGGFAGMWAGYCLASSGKEVAVLEKQPILGGLSKGVKIKDNYYELGAHMFHTDDSELLARFKKLFPDELYESKRFFQINFQGKYYRYPLKMMDIIKGFSLRTNIECFFSMLYYLIKGKMCSVKYRTCEDALIYRFGKKLYKIFFEEYIEKFWGLHPRELDASFAVRRITKLDVVDFVKKAILVLHRFKSLEKTTKQDKFIEPVVGNLYYNRCGGMHRVFERLAEEITCRGGRIFTDVKDVHVAVTERAARHVRFSCGGDNKQFDAGSLISTIPLKEFLEILDRTDTSGVLPLAEKLKYRSLVVVALLVKKKQVMPSALTYFRNLSFNRLNEPKNYGLLVQPPENTILLAELSCNCNDTVWCNEGHTKQIVIQDIVKEGLIDSERDVVEAHILKEEQAYPVFLNGFQSNTEQIADYLGQFDNIYSIGRQGMFQYVNAHVVMKMAEAAAENIISGRSKKQAVDKQLYF